MKIFGKIVKYTFYAIPLLIIAIVIVRLASANDPPESGHILYTDSVARAHGVFGDDFIIHRVSVRNPFTRGDTFRVLDVLYLESSHDLQLTLRSKKNRFEELRELVGLPMAEAFSDLVTLYLRGTTRVITEDGDIREETIIREVYEVSAYFEFENNSYEYIRVHFGNIYVNRITTRLDLFIVDNGREINLDDLDNSEYLGRISIFDINMARSRENINRFETIDLRGR